MGCAESRDRDEVKTTASSPENKLHRMELLSSTVLSNKSEAKTTQNTDLDIYVQLFHQSDLAKNQLYQKNSQEMNRLKFQTNLNTQYFNNVYMYRFMKANDFDMPKAIQMFQDHLQWRHQFKVETIINDFVFWESEEVQKIYPHGYHKTDKEGRPIYIQMLKDVRYEELFRITTQERMKQHYIQSHELLITTILPKSSIHHNKFVGQTFTILDAKDIQLKPMQAKEFVSFLTTFTINNYPEIMGKLYVVNSPILVQVFWKIISAMLNETIRSKIFILGKDYKDILLEYIDKENLPDFLGGESDTQNGALLYKNIGPWNDYGKSIMFPHEDPKQLEKVTTQQKEELKEQINQFLNRRSSVQERASQRNSVSQRQSILKIQQATVNNKDSSSSVDTNILLLEGLENEINHK